MLEVMSNKDIHVSKNETAELKVTIKNGALLEGDIIIFAVKANGESQDELINVTLPPMVGGETNFNIYISSDKFDNLEFGTYKYDILRQNGEIKKYLLWVRNFVIEERIANGE